MGCKNKVNKNDSNMNGEHDVILITGGTSGLGLETALVLAKTFNLATIIVASRSGIILKKKFKNKKTYYIFVIKYNKLKNYLAFHLHLIKEEIVWNN